MQQRISQNMVASLETEHSDLSLGIWVSFAEVYNEYVYDLLQPSPSRGRLRPKLPLGLDSKGKTYIKNLTNINVASGLEAFEILQYGMHNLNYAATSVNKHSSRSHCIFTIKLVQASFKKSECQISHFNFCDLAGSERIKTSCSTGDRLKESNNINTSLHVLGRCIQTIRESQKNNNDHRLIPFRESKLTRLFQPALSGQESICMIVNMNPEKDMFDESQHVLNFSAITRNITVEYAPKIKKPARNRFTEYVETNKLPVDSVSEVDDSESVLREHVKQLQQVIMQQMNEHDLKEFKMRSEMVKMFQEELETEQARNREHTKRMKQSLERDYKNKIEDLEMYYNGILKKRRHAEIDLTQEDVLDEIKQLKVELTRRDVEKTKLKEQLSELCEVLNEAREECIKLKRKNDKLTRELEERVCDIYELKKDKYDLQAELSVSNINHVENAEYVEKLENKLNQTLGDVSDDEFY